MIGSISKKMAIKLFAPWKIRDENFKSHFKMKFPKLGCQKSPSIGAMVTVSKFVLIPFKWHHTSYYQIDLFH